MSHIGRVRSHHRGVGVKAVPLVTRQKPDLVLLDIVLPGVDGLEVAAG